MAHWTKHTELNFHASNNNAARCKLTDPTPSRIVKEVFEKTGCFVICEESMSGWVVENDSPLHGQFVAQPVFIIKHIVGCSADTDDTFNRINACLKSMLGCDCLMATKKQVEVFCECR